MRRTRHRLRLLVGHAVVLALLMVSLPQASPALHAQSENIAVADAFEVTGDAATETLRYDWTVSAASEPWHVSLEVQPEVNAWLQLHSPDGERIEQVTSRDRADLFDMVLEAGTYVIEVGRGNTEQHPFTLTAAPEPDPHDPEPNDRTELAVPLADGSSIRGRLARRSDEDRYAFTVPAGPAMRRMIALDSAVDRTVCVLDADDVEIQCRRGMGGLMIPDIVLPPDEYTILVRGSTRPDPYTLSLSTTGEHQAGLEAEPNDLFTTASPFAADLGVVGGSALDDPDYHVVSIEGEPQLWQVRASGPGIHRLSLVRGGRDEVAISEPPRDGSDALLDDLLLTEGDHVFRIRTREGGYSIAMTPLGPLDPDAEREPNNDAVRAEAYGIGERKTGRLPTVEDDDNFRFTLSDHDHVRLSLEQPSDADHELLLFSSSGEILRRKAHEAGGPIILDLALKPGEYRVWLRTTQPSSDRYALSSERLDPFDLAVDQEPNDNPGDARPAPASLLIRGDRAGAVVEWDWYTLPPLPAPATVTIEHSEARPGLWFYSGKDAVDKLVIERLEDGLFSVADVPADTPLFVQLQAEGPYEARLSAPGWTAIPHPVVPPVELSISLDESVVAAYWPQGQRVLGTVELSNTGSEELLLALEATTSHFGWQARTDQGAVTLAAGSSLAVPLHVDVAPDAWAASPVQITVAATSMDEGRRTARVSMDAAADVAPVGSHLAWAVPDELLGGLNVAGVALGGETLGTIDASRELQLFDDVTPTGGGFIKTGDALPMDLIVDLAGSAPVPIRGTIINPLAQHGNVNYYTERFELLLSTDGQSWSSVLDGELAPLPNDQAFVLDAPVLATQAMLRVHSTQQHKSRTVAIGEWKVIAEPGALPDDMPGNIAEPIRGGHVARHVPHAGNPASWIAMLDEETRRNRVSFDPETMSELEIVLGFDRGRAAQIIELRWQDPDDSDPATRPDVLDVSVSLDGPLGPWQDITTWELARGADGNAAPLQLDAPVWARYVRLASPLPIEGRTVEFPARIEILERPTDDDYRSVLGEWGETSNAGPYELLVASERPEVETGPDAGDTREAATALPLGISRTDRARILEDVDWYRLEVPAGHNTLEFEVRGVPVPGVRLSLFDAGGDAVEAELHVLPGGVNRYVAIVEPGGYNVLVEQPPFNVVFTFDTSGSMGPFLPFVFEGMREFASDVLPGREVVHIVPFDRPTLLDAWSDQPLLLGNAVNNFVPGNESSEVEKGLLASAALLAQRDGTRAILVVADAESGSLNLGPDVWRAFADVQPIVYAVHVGSTGRHEETQNRMRAWADAARGVYSYPSTHAEMNRSFERMSTQLRRPATYSVAATTRTVNREPAQLSVTAAVGLPPALQPGVGVEIIVDTSGSMRKKLDGKRRIDIAKASLRSLFSDALAEGVPLAIRTFGGRGKGKAARCDTRLTQPLAPLDRKAALALTKKLTARKSTKTPIAAALAAVPQDLADVADSRTVVLVTDGDETCGGDPATVIAALRASGINANVNIVGFALDDEELKARMSEWAAAGDGTYFDAASADDLSAAIRLAVSAPFQVYADGAAEPLASGTVGGGPVSVEPGAYRVEVLTDPSVVFESVVLAGGEVIALELPDPSGT